MDKLALLDELLILVQTEEIKTSNATNADSETMLLEIKMLTERTLYDEVVNDITAFQTEYYAPEYSSWKQYLADCNGCKDYKLILDSKFEESELENLWQESHIAEDMDEEQIKKEILFQMGQIKSIHFINKGLSGIKNMERCQEQIRLIQARIKGLQAMFYEE